MSDLPGHREHLAWLKLRRQQLIDAGHQSDMARRKAMGTGAAADIDEYKDTAANVARLSALIVGVVAASQEMERVATRIDGERDRMVPSMRAQNVQRG